MNFFKLRDQGSKRHLLFIVQHSSQDRFLLAR